MSQPEESREKTASTDAVLMHPDNDPRKRTAEVPPRAEHGEIRVESDRGMVPIDTDE
ncbi:hypothetical protein NCC78_28850 [Micromonospora phytophila]|uniref:hypothetical protein n=1 Tax=Micromonospora phytophila TaxID=709888 RepID=UPI00202EA05B|nr:hypothetical protein [Micromonospora phytophila]MCM0678651.1 hypothetical protein [Micromonospora phytophila]